MKWYTLLQPPVWDQAMGLFPAALTLSANGLDLLELLAMPGYMDGGPNTHSTSLVTLVTALVLRVTGEGGATSLVALHLLHFSVAAYALTVLFRFSRPVLGRVATPLFCLAALLFPIFSTQVGYLYLEVPLFLCAVSALHAWTNQRFWPAVLWATAALGVKETGIIVSGTLVIATLLENREARLKLKRMALILAPPALLVAITSLLTRIALAGSGDPPGAPPLGAYSSGYSTTWTASCSTSPTYWASSSCSSSPFPCSELGHCARSEASRQQSRIGIPRRGPDWCSVTAAR